MMDYKREIFKLLEKIKSEWILQQILLFIRNIMKEDD